jgi:hypothetical protein
MRIATGARDGTNALAHIRMNARTPKQARCLSFFTHRENLLRVVLLKVRRRPNYAMARSLPHFPSTWQVETATVE